MKKILLGVSIIFLATAQLLANITFTINTNALDLGNITCTGNWPTTQPTDTVSPDNSNWNGIWNHSATLNMTLINTESKNVMIHVYLQNRDLPGYNASLFNTTQGNTKVGLLNLNTPSQNYLTASVLPLRYRVTSTNIPNYDLFPEYRWILDSANTSDFDTSGNIYYRTAMTNIPTGTWQSSIQFRIATPWGKLPGTYKGKIYLMALSQ